MIRRRHWQSNFDAKGLRRATNGAERRNGVRVAYGSIFLSKDNKRQMSGQLMMRAH